MAGVAELVAILAGSGAALGAMTHPLFRWLTARTLTAKARPEDVPRIAEALHPPMQLRLNRSTQVEAVSGPSLSDEPDAAT
ncbi:hypothetical protein GCM10017567_73240 [Amycolatopsis bullii]|uniref:Uncharacterized protein n=1 Tax=Amycolatopsis bullii TaxID=941987 RepID=A0ABQ3KX57_9PSEU|nr:hypothetical protein GCM10017567_73240 [Amycolatopsis bullii]